MKTEYENKLLKEYKSGKYIHYNRSSVTPGMICRFYYNDEEEYRDCWIISPNFKDKLHGMLLSAIPYSKFLSTFEEIKVFPNLPEEAYTLLNSEFSSFNAYRSFSWTKIKDFQVFVVDFIDFAEEELEVLEE